MGSETLFPNMASRKLESRLATDVQGMLKISLVRLDALNLILGYPYRDSASQAAHPTAYTAGGWTR